MKQRRPIFATIDAEAPERACQAARDAVAQATAFMAKMLR
jgi:hypothetical protein